MTQFLRAFLAFSLTLLTQLVQGQGILGFSNSNYAGTKGTIMNPTAMLHSRMKRDTNLITLDLFAGWARIN